MFLAENIHALCNQHATRPTHGVTENHHNDKSDKLLLSPIMHLLIIMLFNEIVYNNSVIELLQCFGTSFFGRIDHLASSVIKFRPKNSVPKHCIRSITYYYHTSGNIQHIS